MRKGIYLITFLILLIPLLFGCEEGELQTGEASWYGPGFHGQRTSSGEIYDEQELTAAHRTLPFDTIIEVVNTENDSTVQVRINDRGPYEQGRIIDLSRAAGEKLDMMDSGIAEVKLYLVEAGGNIPDDLDQEVYTLQLGEYGYPRYAETLVDDIGGEAYLHFEHMFGRGRYFVYYGSYTSIADANRELERLRDDGFDGIVKQIN